MMMRLPIFLNVVALHIPDGFLSVPVALLGLLIALIVLAYTLRQTRDLLGERQIPMLGVMAAFVFAAQSINFPVLGGTSGHLLGGALVAIVVGPWPAVLVMTVVAGLQALLFQDGGLLAIGWNIVNMAILAVLTGALTFGLLRRILGTARKNLIISTMVAAWISVVLSATATGVELAASDPGLLAAVPAMAGIHAIIGLGEALITGAAVILIAKARPAILHHDQETSDFRTAYILAFGLIITLAVATFSVVSSTLPDGLERVALDYGFADRAVDPVLRFLPDYTLPGIEGNIGGVIVIIGGAILTSMIILLTGRLVRHRQSRRVASGESSRISATGD
ncbi:MAG: energy-coupling factor ABC transporter permease [Candidatus Promineifilaceae bacterium]